LDREEFYRLKKVSNKKQRDSAAADAEIVAAREREAADREAADREAADREAADKRAAEVETVPEAPDVLGENEDADVIF
jgi:V-type H+-transporting ATPase subunit D